jgi:hypothetical protein
MTSYITLLSKIEQFCNAHLQIKKYGGEFREQMPNFSTKDEKYPVVFVEPLSDLEDLNTNQFSINVYCVDIIQKDRANLNTILSDCQLILKDMYVYYINDMDAQLDVVGTATMTPLNNYDLDYVAGWVMGITFEVATYGPCEIPMNPITPTPVECQDGSVENSDGSYTSTVASGGLLILPDVNLVVKDQDGNILSDETYPSVQDEEIIVTLPECEPATYDLYNSVPTLISSGSIPCGDNATITAPDGIVHIKHEADGTIANVSTPSNGTTEYIIQNNDITVNGGNGFVIHAEEPLDILLQNQSGGTISAQSVTYNGNQDHVNIVINTASFVPVGATLQKTGQSVINSTGDDGATQRGRLTNFTTLASNNPFGNTNRFTNKNGGQGYGQNVALDWSTYNGSTVLAYYFGDSTTRTWSTQLTQYSFSTIDGLNGWNLFNIYEAMNIMNFSFPGGYLYNYAPFNLTRRYMFVSTNQTGTTGISTETAGPNPFTTVAKSSSLWGIWVRVCYVNGTTIS